MFGFFASLFASSPTQSLPTTESLLGIREYDLVQLSESERFRRFLVYEGFRNELTGDVTPYGTFDTPTVACLKEQVASVLLELPTTKQELWTKPPPLTTRSRVDIAQLQGNLTTKDLAMVQVASNLNCLENPSRHTNPANGFLVDFAYQDRTQGPAAVFGTTSAYLYRCHFYKGGQTSDSKCANLVEHAGSYFGVPQNGKLTLTGHEEAIVTETDMDEVSSKVCIGLHRDCPLLFRRTRNRMIEAVPGDNGPPLIDHVLSASVNMHDYGIVVPADDRDKLYKIAQTLLRAAYEGIYLAAILRQRKKLYLTLVGGGSFGNPIAMIVAEIQRAHNLWAGHPASQLEECVICLYNESTELEVRAAMAE